jgi:hypothetical protein
MAACLHSKQKAMSTAIKKKKKGQLASPAQEGTTPSLWNRHKEKLPIKKKNCMFLKTNRFLIWTSHNHVNSIWSVHINVYLEFK